MYFGVGSGAPAPAVEQLDDLLEQPGRRGVSDLDLELAEPRRQTSSFEDRDLVVDDVCDEASFHIVELGPLPNGP